LAVPISRKRRPAARILLGPVFERAPRVRKAMRRRWWGHLDPDSSRLMEAIKRMLRIGLPPQQRITFPVSGTGSAGMETREGNPDRGRADDAVVGVMAPFGGTLAEVAGTAGRKRASRGGRVGPDSLSLRTSKRH